MLWPRPPSSGTGDHILHAPAITTVMLRRPPPLFSGDHFLHKGHDSQRIDLNPDDRTYIPDVDLDLAFFNFEKKYRRRTRQVHQQ
jgi:hypothetical protein